MDSRFSQLMRGRGLRLGSPLNQERNGAVGRISFNLVRGLPLENGGSIYDTFNGTFGYIVNLIIKQATSHHSALVYNEVRRLQMLRPCPRFPMLVYFECDDRFLRVGMEMFDHSCQSILEWYEPIELSDEEAVLQPIPRFSVQRLFAEIFDGLKFLHGRRIIHRDIQAKNVFVQIVNGSWHTVYSGLKYSKVKGSYTDDVDTAFNLKVWDWKVEKPNEYDYNDDFYSVACLMYSFYVGRLVLSPAARISPVWAEEETNYRQVQMKHFIRVVLYATIRGKTFKVDSYLAHPYFMSEAWMCNFEDIFRTYVSTQRTLKDILENGRRIVFTGSFLDQIHPEVADYIRYTNQQNRMTLNKFQITEMMRVARNKRVHDQENLEGIRFLMGYLPVDNFLFWSRAFPYFFIYIFLKISAFKPSRLETRVCSNVEFTHFFTAEKSFYDYCNAIPLQSAATDLF